MSLDDLQEKIAEFEDYIQSSDVAAMQSTFPISAQIKLSLTKVNIEL